MTEHSDFVSVKEAASILGVHEQTVRGYVDEGILPKKQVKKGARVRIPRAAVLSYVSDERPGSTPPAPAKPEDEPDKK